MHFMKEAEAINIIKKTLSDSSFIGDDCAELNGFNLFITQDSLVEDVHFSLDTTTPYQLGIKAVAVNISDLATRLCTPLYISVGLSLPKDITSDFVRELYKGIDFACSKYGVKVTGGDVTGSDKIVISIAAIGQKRYKHDISRAFAKVGDYVVTTGFYGSSAAGLYSLKNKIFSPQKLTDACLTPVARTEEAKLIEKYLDYDLAVADSSDGLADTLYKIAEASSVSIKIDYDNIPVLPETKDFAKRNNIDEKDLVLWGGEDFELIFCISEDTFNKIDKKLFKFIGKVEEKTDKPKVIIYNKDFISVIDGQTVEQKSFDHFGG